jgi:hypothetical protein
MIDDVLCGELPAVPTPPGSLLQRQAPGMSAVPGSPWPGPGFSLGAPDLPRIAVYDEPPSLPAVTAAAELPLTEENLPAFVESLAVRVHDLARAQGGSLPIGILRELIDNLVHAGFAGVVITILDGGNTVRISDRGPGIKNKEAALRPGFTSADSWSRRFIRGVGSGFSLVQQALTALDGTLEIDDNLGQGTVVTVRLNRTPNIPLAPGTVPSYNLSKRQLKTLLLAVELAPVGPTRIAQELGVSTSTAYRDLVFLEEAGFVSASQTGHRSVTEVGLAYLDALL